MDTNGHTGFLPLSIALVIYYFVGIVFFSWLFYKAAKRVVREVKVLKNKGARSANWIVLTLAFLFVAGFIASLVCVLFGGGD